VRIRQHEISIETTDKHHDHKGEGVKKHAAPPKNPHLKSTSEIQHTTTSPLDTTTADNSDTSTRDTTAFLTNTSYADLTLSDSKTPFENHGKTHSETETSLSQVKPGISGDSESFTNNPNKNKKKTDNFDSDKIILENSRNSDLLLSSLNNQELNQDQDLQRGQILNKDHHLKNSQNSASLKDSRQSNTNHPTHSIDNKHPLTTRQNNENQTTIQHHDQENRASIQYHEQDKTTLHNSKQTDIAANEIQVTEENPLSIRFEKRNVLANSREGSSFKDITIPNTFEKQGTQQNNSKGIKDRVTVNTSKTQSSKKVPAKASEGDRKGKKLPEINTKVKIPKDDDWQFYLMATSMAVSTFGVLMFRK